MTGGTYTWDDLGNQGMTPENAENLGAGVAYDANGALKPLAVITFGVGSPHPDIPQAAESRFFSVWMWQQQGFLTIRAARKLLKGPTSASDPSGLLNRRKLAESDDESINYPYYVDEREFYDPTMGDRPAMTVRFFIDYVRT